MIYYFSDETHIPLHGTNIYEYNLQPSEASSTKSNMWVLPTNRDDLSRLRREAIRPLKSKLFTDEISKGVRCFLLKNINLYF